MYISKLSFENYGPLENIEYISKFNKDGMPYPIVVFGQNGSGKTLFLSNILHSLIEIKKRKYGKIEEVSEGYLYRVSALKYINNKANFSFNRIEFSEEASFTEVMTRDYAYFKNVYSELRYPGVNVEDKQLKEQGFYHATHIPNLNVFEKEVFLYFPVDRYYIPAWLNKENDKLLYAGSEQEVVGKSSSNIVKYNVLANIEEWLLDVIIDKELYERQRFVIDKNQEIIPTYFGRNNNIQGTINAFLSILYKHKGYDGARIAITERHNLYRQIKIVGRKGEQEEEIMPSLSSMSSGEAMVLGIMASILREADRVGVGNFDIKNIKGIVLIDEIDAHMHSNFIQDALPELIGFFSGIQFVVSSHSPFFLLGMKDYFGADCNFVELPSGEVVDNFIDFGEIRNCFNMVNKTYINVIYDYKMIEAELQQVKKPIVITEGKTDWKHLKHALEVFHRNGIFTRLNLNFLEYEEEMGAEKLEALLTKLAMISQIAPVFGIFDNDSKTGKKYLTPHSFGNNVFAVSLFDTQGYCEEISIELLYAREDLTKLWLDGRRVYLSDEFTENSHHLKVDHSIVSQNNTIKDAYKRGIVKVVDSEVFNGEEREMAVSKNEFATQIYEGKYPYEDINIEGFKPLYQTLEKMLNKESNSSE